MGEITGIEWTAKRDAAGKIIQPGATWNPWHGCHKIDELCKFCYMYREKRKYGQEPNIVVRSKTTFYAPLDWHEPRFVFTCSWSDWCVEEADEWRDEAWSIIKRTRHLTYQILTKRTDRLARCLPSDWDDGRNYPHVWLGFSAGTQASFEKRWSEIQGIQARVWFLSAEPLLEKMSIASAMPMFHMCRPNGPMTPETARAMMQMLRAAGKARGVTTLDWVIGGGETGDPEEDIRVTHPAAFRQMRDECVAFGLPFTFKQWGDYAPCDDEHPHDHVFADGTAMCRVGKRSAGRELDGRVWNEMPQLEDAA